MPVWSANGHELYYAAPNGAIMAATVHAGIAFLADTPRALFSPRIRLITGVTRRQFDVSRDGRFLVNTLPLDSQAVSGITLVQNWTVKIPQ